MPHTPGPWDTACDSYGKVQHSRKYDCVYASVGGPGGDRIISVAARIENHDNARLIAAAPDLLAACEAALALLREEDVELADMPVQRQIAAAIRKARGDETPPSLSSRQPGEGD